MQRVLVCPHCNDPSFTVWQKQVLGPGRKKRCRRCGALISVSRIHSVPTLLLTAAFPVVVAVAFLKHGIIVTVSVIALMLLVNALYQHYLVPLVVRQPPESIEQ